MRLKTNYKNDKFEGKRKYKLINNDDSTISLDDITRYEENGDIFNADDINATNRAVNETVDGFSEVRNENSQFQAAMTQNFSALQSSVNQNIQDIKKVRMINLPASGWSNSIPYTQTRTISGITNGDTPAVALVLTGTLSASTVKAQRKAFGYLDRAVTGSGTITFYCYEKKPDTDFSVQVKGE